MLKKVEKGTIIKGWRETLEELDYKLIPSGKEYRTRAVYRSGDSPNSIAIYPENGTFYDFPAQKSGTLAELIALTKNITVAEVEETLEYQEKKHIESFVKALDYPRVFNSESFSKLGTNYTYFEKRGISKETQKLFEAKYVSKEKMAGRIVYPIRDFHGRIIGLNGRSINWEEGNSYPKWLIVGSKRFFVYNHKVATPAIQKEGLVILLESCGDVLSLYESGIPNTICTFGLSLSPAIIKYLISHNCHIAISLNRDQNNRGQEGAEKMKAKLLQYFSVNKITIDLPPVVGDWNEILCQKDGRAMIQHWYKDLKERVKL